MAPHRCSTVFRSKITTDIWQSSNQIDANNHQIYPHVNSMQIENKKKIFISHILYKFNRISWHALYCGHWWKKSSLCLLFIINTPGILICVYIGCYLQNMSDITHHMYVHDTSVFFKVILYIIFVDAESLIFRNCDQCCRYEGSDSNQSQGTLSFLW